jgi:hypothetical protein
LEEQRVQEVVEVAVLEPLVCLETAETAEGMPQEQVKQEPTQPVTEQVVALAAAAIMGMGEMEQKDISVLFIGVQTEC